uniref:Putative translation initiation factor if-2 n=1 Tax=Amblyomma parvum TaxID=251391 RepID=A0A023FZK4_AMBPA
MTCMAFLVLCGGLSTATVGAVYVTERIIECGGTTCTTNQDCLDGCECFEKQDQPEIRRCFDPHGYIRYRFRSLQNKPPEPARVPQTGLLSPWKPKLPSRPGQQNASPQVARPESSAVHPGPATQESAVTSVTRTQDHGAAMKTVNAIQSWTMDRWEPVSVLTDTPIPPMFRQTPGALRQPPGEAIKSSTPQVGKPPLLPRPQSQRPNIQHTRAGSRGAAPMPVRAQKKSGSMPVGRPELAETGTHSQPASPGSQGARPKLLASKLPAKKQLPPSPASQRPRPRLPGIAEAPPLPPRESTSSGSSLSPASETYSPLSPDTKTVYESPILPPRRPVANKKKTLEKLLRRRT